MSVIYEPNIKAVPLEPMPRRMDWYLIALDVLAAVSVGFYIAGLR